MSRYKDNDWDLPKDSMQWSLVPIAVLMDIRDELKTLNKLLHCHNFTNLPRTMKSIDRRLAIRVPLRKKRK